MTDVLDTAPSDGAAVDVPFDSRLRGLLETAWPGVSESIAGAEASGVHWRELSTTHFAPGDSAPLAHAGVLAMPWAVGGVCRRVAGIHAVCTHPLYQGRGLMREVMTSALAQCDREFETTVLFTIEPALYRRFGFRVVPQTVYELRERLPRRHGDSDTRKLVPTDPTDVALLRSRLGTRDLLSRRLAMSRESVDLFLLNEMMETGGFERLYLVPAFDTIVAAEPQGTTLVIHDVIAEKLPPLLDLIAAIPFDPEKVELHFSPDRMHGLRFSPLPLVSHEHLMIRGPLGLDEEELVVPQHIRC